ncbi:MAG: serine/threonine protein kinase, partial [Planctomycetes bacterium]|nr:serine/threonine protein kinase [Planctomycetota bacterium]
MSSLINGTAMPELGATNTMIGRKLGIYEIREELGKGGMGAVYKAYDTSLDRFVALKILPAMLALDRTLVERFQHEARAIAKVRHPNLVHIYGVGEEEGLNYFAMEYIEGKSLADAIRKRQRLASRVAISVLGQVMAGLNKVHQLNMVHRDIKPANIMIDRDGRAVLMDFGLAKGDERGLTTEGTII